MKSITLSLVLMSFCFLGNGYAMDSHGEISRKVFDAESILKTAEAHINLKNRVVKETYFKSVDDINIYDREATTEIINLIDQAKELLDSVLEDANTKSHQKSLADSLLKKASKTKAQICNNSNL